MPTGHQKHPTSLISKSCAYSPPTQNPSTKAMQVPSSHSCLGERPSQGLPMLPSIGGEEGVECSVPEAPCWCMIKNNDKKRSQGQGNLQLALQHAASIPGHQAML